ncbi:MAG: hypothetical protein WCI20_13860 [bacterium]
MRIEDLPPRLQAQVRAQIAGERNPPSFAKAMEGMEVRSQNPEVRKPSHAPNGGRKSKGPNKTEVDYQRRHLRGLDARYEAVTFRMANGHRYTPDWVVFTDGRPSQCHECKGGYALHSQQRARLAFDQVRVEFPGLVWVWAVRVGGRWTVDSGQ